VATQPRSHIVHLLFEIGVITKGIDGALEIIGGALLFFISPDQLRHIARILTLHELTKIRMTLWRTTFCTPRNAFPPVSRPSARSICSGTALLKLVSSRRCYDGGVGHILRRSSRFCFFCCTSFLVTHTRTRPSFLYSLCWMS